MGIILIPQKQNSESNVRTESDSLVVFGEVQKLNVEIPSLSQKCIEPYNWEVTFFHDVEIAVRAYRQLFQEHH